jgi:hypothetical protein
VKFIPPILALAIVAAWLISQRHAINSTESEIVVLREQVRLANASAGPDGSDPSLASRIRDNPVGSPDGPLDWKRIGEKLAANQGTNSIPDMRAMMALQTRLMEMSTDEMVEALDEIIALDITDAIRAQLESMLIGRLAQEDPQLALERFGDRIGDRQGGIQWQLSNALRTWADDDPAAAGAWLDRQVAAGHFDSTSLSGRNPLRTQYEAAIIGSLLASDPANAGRRLAVFSEDQRSEILQQGWQIRLKPETQAAFAALVRDQLPQARHADALANVSNTLAHGKDGYRKVGEFLERIDATDNERAAIAGRTADTMLREGYGPDGFDPEKVRELRAWLAEQAPGEADSITGSSLGRTGGDFDHTVALVTKLHAEYGSDDLLVSFLEQSRVIGNPDATRPLIDKISDPQRREEVRKKHVQPAAGAPDPVRPDPFAP